MYFNFLKLNTGQPEATLILTGASNPRATLFRTSSLQDKWIHDSCVKEFSENQ